jgi:hypothetical protein
MACVIFWSNKNFSFAISNLSKGVTGIPGSVYDSDIVKAVSDCSWFEGKKKKKSLNRRLWPH